MNGPQRIQDLGLMLGLSNSTVSGLVDRLEEKGMVERRRSEEDRRSVYVHVTKKQKHKIYEMHNEFDLRINTFVDSLSKAELETLHTILDKLEMTIRYTESEDDE
jgi:DNA-binding MarR family transcriptional regulator